MEPKINESGMNAGDKATDAKDVPSRIVHEEERQVTVFPDRIVISETIPESVKETPISKASLEMDREMLVSRLSELEAECESVGSRIAEIDAKLDYWK